jgi:hypothetical protein
MESVFHGLVMQVKRSFGVGKGRKGTFKFLMGLEFSSKLFKKWVNEIEEIIY